MDDDTLAWARPKSTLNRPRAAERAPAPEIADGEAAAGEALDPLPLPGSPYLAAYSRPSNKPEAVLHVLLKDGYFKGFAWANFDSIDTAPGEPGGGPVLLVRFSGLVPVELRIAGRNLGLLHAHIGRHRIIWIRERPDKRGFDGATAEPAEIITAITVRTLEG